MLGCPESPGQGKRAAVSAASGRCQDERVYQRHLIPWILASALVCAGLGAWGGEQLDQGQAGNIALISVACAVLGSFLPGAARFARTRLRDRRPHHDAA
jgi:hypothetical protein